MSLLKLVKDYINENRISFYSYVFICCVGYFVRVIVTSLIYGQFFETNVGQEDLVRVIKNICLVWVSLSVLYIIQLRLEY